jgi:hypothetical protein
MFSNALSQLALLETKMWAIGRSGTSSFRLPAGTMMSVPFARSLGSADPQIEQKDLPCRVEGRV